MARVSEDDDGAAAYREGLRRGRAKVRRFHAAAIACMVCAASFVGLFAKQPVVGVRVGLFLFVAYAFVVILEGLTRRLR